ncbi:hypothetical protein A2U01_0048897, partial [Trifolium medium]|nr:hypothetical protein [Trifolium medium]
FASVVDFRFNKLGCDRKLMFMNDVGDDFLVSYGFLVCCYCEGGVLGIVE